MKKQLLILTLSLLSSILMAQNSDIQGLTQKLDNLMAAQFKATETGAAALVARNGQVIYKKAFGMADLEHDIPMRPDHIFRIGSITKQFTAIAILQLMEQGKLELQDEITRFVPGYPTQGKHITIEHLLTHTSGIQSYTAMKDFVARMRLDYTPVEMIDYFKNEPLKFEPGTQYNYSNSGYFLLGYIIEQVSGLSYPEYLEKNFFKPLGMTSSSFGSDIAIVKNRAGAYSASEHGFENAQPMSMSQPYAAGSIQSTVEDLFKWHQAVLAYKLVTKESLTKAFTPYTLTDGTQTHYGYGWSFASVQGSPTIEHGGGINGFQTMAMFLPQEDVFAVVFSNCDCNSPDDITARLAAHAIGQSYEHEAIQVENALLQEYTGVYENEKGEQRIITVSENQLYSQRGSNPPFLIKSYEKDRFYFEEVLMSIEFIRNKKGAVEMLITKRREGNEDWHKTNNPVKSGAEIKVDATILESYVGEYEIEPTFTFVVTREQDRLFLQGTEQDQVEMFAETETKFFLKVNDARIEFVKNDMGNVTKAILNQGGRQADAKKIK